MQKEKLKLGPLSLVGLTVRTNNKNEMDPNTSKIGALAGTYWGEQVANHFKHRVTPGVSYSVYTEYESDEQGDYSYFIGEAVESMQEQDLVQFNPLLIPESQYQKFTTKSGAMPDVVISAWQKIWVMQANDLGGKRQYIADFEVYDQRAADPNNTVVDIYIGIED